MPKSTKHKRIENIVCNDRFPFELSFTDCEIALWYKVEKKVPSEDVSVQGSGIKYRGLFKLFFAFIGETAPTLNPFFF